MYTIYLISIYRKFIISLIIYHGIRAWHCSCSPSAILPCSASSLLLLLLGSAELRACCSPVRPLFMQESSICISSTLSLVAACSRSIETILAPSLNNSCDLLLLRPSIYCSHDDSPSTYQWCFSAYSLDCSNYNHLAYAIRSFLKWRMLWWYITGNKRQLIQGDKETDEAFLERLEVWDVANHFIVT